MVSKKSTNFVFSPRNPIATVSQELYAIRLVDFEDFEDGNSDLQLFYLEVSELFTMRVRNRLMRTNHSDMFEDYN